jgi:gliding motility-associated-like protein
MIDEPSALAINSNVTNVSCFGEGDGRIITTLSGGTGNYTYNWNNGATGHRIENLVPGTYSVEVLDANNCSITDTNAITEPDELSVGVSSVSNVLCFGESNGMINVAAMGGNMPFSYSLDGVIFQSSPTIENLAAGEYTVTVRDDRGCEVMSNTATVDQPAEFAVIAETDRTVANLGFTVNLSATATGNNSGVNFVWSTPDSVVCTNCPTFETTPPGSTTYTVTAVNSDNCTATASIKIAVSLDRPVYIPNAFSPNGDGQNDEFFIPFSPAMSSIKELRIFDRTGNLVYEAFDIMRGEEFSRAWDGEFNGSKLRYGVFVISAQIHFVDGQTLPYQSDLTLFGEE